MNKLNAANQSILVLSESLKQDNKPQKLIIRVQENLEIDRHAQDSLKDAWNAMQSLGNA